MLLGHSPLVLVTLPRSVTATHMSRNSDKNGNSLKMWIKIKIEFSINFVIEFSDQN